MHPTAYENCRMFFKAYGPALANNGAVRVVDIGAQDINGSLKTVVPAGFEYVGVDFVEGKGVDIVLDDPYELPLESDSVDVVLCNSCFEHSEMFWLSFLEVLRILKPHGLFYLNVPSNGSFHRYPVDCWRFYPDAGNALVKWAKKNDFDAVLTESFLSEQNGAIWNDFVAVFLRDSKEVKKYPKRIIDIKHDFTNGLKYENDGFLNHSRLTEDQRKLSMVKTKF